MVVRRTRKCDRSLTCVIGYEGKIDLIISARKSASQVVVHSAGGMQALLYRRGGVRAPRGWLGRVHGPRGWNAGRVAGMPALLAVRLGLKQWLTESIN